MLCKSQVNIDPVEVSVSHGYQFWESTLKFSKFFSIHKNKSLPNDVPFLSSISKKFSQVKILNNTNSFYIFTCLAAAIEHSRDNLVF